jgi:predicted HicB family RNase H-like nuclease
MEKQLSYKAFIGSINFNSADQIFFGHIEGIEDLVTFEGATVDELENAFKLMVEQHIQDCIQEGRSAGKY